MAVIDLSMQGTQTALAELVGVTQPTISNLMTDGKLPATGTLGELLLAYCARLRDQAAGRMGENTTLDLVQERAALAREQREGQAIKNAVARREYAPVGLLADVLGMAASSVVGRGRLAAGIWARRAGRAGELKPVLIFTRVGIYRPRLGMERIAKNANLQAYLERRLRYQIREAVGV